MKRNAGLMVAAKAALAGLNAVIETRNIRAR